MPYYIDRNGNYYEGDRVHPQDVSINRKPYTGEGSEYYYFDLGGTNDWIFDYQGYKQYLKEKFHKLLGQFCIEVLYGKISSQTREQFFDNFTTRYDNLKSTVQPLTTKAELDAVWETVENYFNGLT